MAKKENQAVARLWYEIKNNLQRWTLEWEWMAEWDEGNYLEYDDVLRTVEKYLYEDVQEGENNGL